jgi:hypothetical protein
LTPLLSAASAVFPFAFFLLFFFFFFAAAFKAESAEFLEEGCVAVAVRALEEMVSDLTRLAYRIRGIGS